MVRYFSSWLVQVKQSQTNAPLAQPNNDRRSFQMAVEPAASTMESGDNHPMNRASRMRFAALIDSKYLKNTYLIYETRQSAAPPFAWRFAPSPPQRLRASSEEPHPSQADLFPENRLLVHRLTG
jgi:hypothetical protein